MSVYTKRPRISVQCNACPLPIVREVQHLSSLERTLIMVSIHLQEVIPLFSFQVLLAIRSHVRTMEHA
jgi:hypothetical protein